MVYVQSSNALFSSRRLSRQELDEELSPAMCSSGLRSVKTKPGAGKRVFGIGAELLTYASRARMDRGSVALIIELTAAGIEPA